jgi:hypothetical protein
LSVSTYCKPDPGQIEFGRDLDASNQALQDCSASFKQVGDFAFVGFFADHVTGSVDLEVSKDGSSPTKVGSYTFSTPGNYYGGRWHLSDFPGPGIYVLSMTRGGATLATGQFTLTQ